jgi:pimeloyl-ACP methyl ester carboxylesterase
MKHLNRFLLLSSLLLLCSTTISAQAHPEASMRNAVAEACAAAKQLPGLAPAVCSLGGVERRHLVRDIFEYSFLLRVGTGEHDLVKIHRVVRERAHGVPFRTEQAVFMVHGDLWGFDGAFLGSTLSGNVPREQSIGIHLASKGLDVWGIDLRWVQVSADTTDLSFMKDWNISTHVRDIAAGIGVARAVRGATGAGAGKVSLLGWSRGAILAYAYANEEARLPEEARQVKALIPVDIAFKFGAEHEEQRAGACVRYAANKQILDSGRYHSDQGIGVRTFGLLAATDPAAQSPVPGFGGLSNSQVALLVGSATHILFAPNPPVPFYHFNAGIFNEAGLPTELQFTREAYFYDFLQAAQPFQSFTEMVETEALSCGNVDSPYDDHLAEINVPVFYVGAEGGFGSYGLDTLALLGSTDASSHLVQLYPAQARAIEFGHADLFLADNARELVWEPIYNWVVNH